MGGGGVGVIFGGWGVIFWGGGGGWSDFWGGLEVDLMGVWSDFWGCGVIFGGRFLGGCGVIFGGLGGDFWGVGG